MKLLTLALRNLTRNLRRTLLTVAAIGFGLTMMLTMVTITAGQYREMLTQGISNLAGHVVIEHAEMAARADNQLVVPGADALIHGLRERLPDATVAPRLQLPGLLTSPLNSIGVGLRGVDPLPEASVIQLDDRIVEGAWLTPDDERGLIIGRGLADRLGVAIDDKVVFMGQSVDGEVESRLFRVRGIFRSGSAELDGFVAIAPIGAVQALMGRPDSVHQVTVHLPDPSTTDAAREVARGLLPPDSAAVALTWSEALPDLLAFIRMDRVSADLMMLVLALIVSMGVLNTVLMSVLERTREFGVLLALGMRPRRVAALVLLEGLVLGLVGAAVGLVGGVALSSYFVTYGLDYTGFVGETIETGGVVMSALLMGAWDPARIAQYAFASVLFTVLAAVYPAWHIARQRAIDAMRHS